MEQIKQRVNATLSLILEGEKKLRNEEIKEAQYMLWKAKAELEHLVFLLSLNHDEENNDWKRNVKLKRIKSLEEAEELVSLTRERLSQIFELLEERKEDAYRIGWECRIHLDSILIYLEKFTSS